MTKSQTVYKLNGSDIIYKLLKTSKHFQVSKTSMKKHKKKNFNFRLNNVQMGEK